MSNWRDNLHPDFARKVAAIVAEMTEAGYPIRITDGYRSRARQAFLFAKRPRVTWTMYSTHRLGMAADAVPLVDGKPKYTGLKAQETYREWHRRCKEKGLHSIPNDTPHIQYIPVSEQARAWKKYKLYGNLSRLWQDYRDAD